MKELIDSEEKFLENLRDSFRMRSHYFPIERELYPAFFYSYEEKQWIPFDPNVHDTKTLQGKRNV